MSNQVKQETDAGPSMITLFACPKAFHGHIDTIQRNAIISWTRLSPKPEIILLGIDEGVAEICNELGLIHVAEVERNEYGTPLVNSVFKIGQARANHPVVCYINSDIILTDDFLRAMESIAAKMPRFLVLGQRMDIEINAAWNFDSPDWQADLKNLLAQKGILHAPTGIDFFCFPRGLYQEIPPFAIGRLKWDNWLVWWARTQGFPVVDITKAVRIAHQNHGYDPGTLQKLEAEASIERNHGRPPRKLTGVRVTWTEIGAEARQNMELAGERNLNIWAANWMLDPKGRLRRRQITLIPEYIYYQMKCVIPLYWPAFGKGLAWITSVTKHLLRRTDQKKNFGIPGRS